MFSRPTSAPRSYVMMLYAGPDTPGPGLRALDDAHMLLAEGHQVLQVFFYGPGVLYAHRNIAFAEETPNLQRAWQELADANNVTLVACSTVADQYGMNPEADIAPGFSAGGLAEFIEQLASADQFKQY